MISIISVNPITGEICIEELTYGYSVIQIFGYHLVYLNLRTIFPNGIITYERKIIGLIYKPNKATYDGDTCVVQNIMPAQYVSPPCIYQKHS